MYYVHSCIGKIHTFSGQVSDVHLAKKPSMVNKMIPINKKTCKIYIRALINTVLGQKSPV